MARPLPSLRAGLFVSEQAMPKVPWHLFQDRQPRAHLVVGAIAEPDAPIGGSELAEAQVVLRRLGNEQKPAGDYAATLVRDTGRPEVYLAFDDEGDARNFRLCREG